MPFQTFFWLPHFPLWLPGPVWQCGDLTVQDSRTLSLCSTKWVGKCKIVREIFSIFMQAPHPLQVCWPRRGLIGLSLRELQQRSWPLVRMEKVDHRALIETKDLFTVILAQQGGATYSQCGAHILHFPTQWLGLAYNCDVKATIYIKIIVPK